MNYENLESGLKALTLALALLILTSFGYAQSGSVQDNATSGPTAMKPAAVEVSANLNPSDAPPAAVLPSGAGIATAQPSSAQLCVANMESIHTGPGTATGRDLLMKFLAKEKDKSVAQPVPINSFDPEQALKEAKSKNCAYLLTTKQTESHIENSYMTGAFGETSSPTFYVTMVYKLTKVSDGSELASGNVKAADHASEPAAIGTTMHKIADKVTQTTKKAGV